MSYSKNQPEERVILHVDADGFFAACEVAKNPSLRGKPVVVGADRGIALALTYEAKALGIKRGMSIYEIRKQTPQAIILPSDFTTYMIMSNRMKHIVDRYTTQVEEYSIDECFADITQLEEPLKKSHCQIALEIKQTLQQELGITFSVGLANTKVLAKIASRLEKPNGFTIIQKEDIPHFLARVPIEDVWGIGRQTSKLLTAHGVTSALALKEKDQAWVKHILAKPYQEIWSELNGISILPIKNKTEAQQSILRTRTFSPASKNKSFILAQLINNIEIATMKARQMGAVAASAQVFLKTQTFIYQTIPIRLSRPTNTPEHFIAALLPKFESLWKPVLYRATGVSLSPLTRSSATQPDLFHEQKDIERWGEIHSAIDQINARYDSPLVHLAGSMRAQIRGKNTEQFSHLIEMPFAGEIN